MFSYLFKNAYYFDVQTFNTFCGPVCKGLKPNVVPHFGPKYVDFGFIWLYLECTDTKVKVQKEER